ncbi:predicted protein [Sclerotinia sclerotiorum 1980 UF-70]|uniref:Uncharacterized protein n=1 Tax=Sclerotinia sclerotiorum (strain ATCC 18683 / 1980 / Ss-1) TaxID=665079 RepID=A7F0M5_SCLS1|nr:predicted protein [Sclerotinia sclerotiorum 1980 UF-70]EDN95267.1 predicted protein [Sclerotinia sclerotiorum 1980 UF-70]
MSSSTLFRVFGDFASFQVAYGQAKPYLPGFWNRVVVLVMLM